MHRSNGILIIDYDAGDDNRRLRRSCQRDALRQMMFATKQISQTLWYFLFSFIFFFFFKVSVWQLTVRRRSCRRVSSQTGGTRREEKRRRLKLTGSCEFIAKSRHYLHNSTLIQIGNSNNLRLHGHTFTWTLLHGDADVRDGCLRFL